MVLRLRLHFATACATLSLLAVVSCKKATPPPPAPRTSPLAASASASGPTSDVVPIAIVTTVEPPANTAADAAAKSDFPDVEAVITSWNAATNAADPAALSAVYAPQLSLYGQPLSTGVAVQRKVDAVTKSPGFSQTLGSVRVALRANGDAEASFDKTSGAGGKASKVPAYLLLRKVDGAWRIVDEGDLVTDRRRQAHRDTVESAWGERTFRCPTCAHSLFAPDDQPEPAPQAFPPLGPESSNAEGEPPPGAPKVIHWARLMAERFASAADVPLFVAVTHTSGNGDGRWFDYEIPVEGGTPKTLLDCAMGGGFFYESPQPGKPDLGHLRYPEITATENVSRDAEGIHYTKHLYAPDKIDNFVECTIAPEYERYFMPLVKRVGRSLRVTSGGWYERKARESQPY